MYLRPKMGQALCGEELVKLPVPKVLVGAIKAEAVAAHACCPHSIKALWCGSRPLQVTGIRLDTTDGACMSEFTNGMPAIGKLRPSKQARPGCDCLHSLAWHFKHSMQWDGYRCARFDAS